MTVSILEHALHTLAGMTVEWRCGADTTTQRIYFGNHASHLDFLAIWSGLPSHLRRAVRPVAGRDYWERDRLRRYLATHVFNAILVDRQSPRHAQPAFARATIECIAREMGATHSAIVFPEGTRSMSGDVGAFKSGLYFLAQLRPDAALVPVYLENLHRMLPEGESIPVPMLSRVVFGPRFESPASQEKDVFLTRARASVIALSRTTPPLTCVDAPAGGKGGGLSDSPNMSAREGRAA
jgi:1-acyl-sn-glycerol-3-phosphate acyltransferase